MMERVKGYIHVHSNYSYDGKNSIHDIGKFFREKGYRFVCLTEHADDFNDQKMRMFLNNCSECSDEQFVVVPGLEYRCKDIVHLLGLGVSELSLENDPVLLARHIKRNGGVAIIAHPRGYEEHLSPELLKLIDGVEIWNGAKDSRFFPHFETLQMFDRLKNSYPALIGLGGADIHSLNRYFPLDIMLKESSDVPLLQTLTDGIASIRGTYWTLPLNGDLSLQAYLLLKVLRLALRLGKGMITRWERP